MTQSGAQSGAQRQRGAQPVAPRGRSRATVAAVGAVSLALVLAACGTVPGAAVDVGGQRIAQSAVLDRVNAVLDAAGSGSSATGTGGGAAADDATRALTARTQITDLVRHDLATRAAKSAGLTVGAKDVNDYLAQFDAYQKSSGSPDLASVLQVPSGDVRNTVYDLLVLDALIKKVPASGADVTDVSVTVDAVPAATWTEAVADRLRFTADPASMDAAAAAARAANPNLPGGPESLLQQPQHAAFGLFSAADGQILIIPQADQGYLVTRVAKRTEKPAKLTAQMITGAAQTAGLGGEIALASLLLGQEAARMHVEVNPRFGVWDPQTVQVVAAGPSS